MCFKKISLTTFFFFTVLISSAQYDDDPILSSHRFSLGASINRGNFFLQGSENGYELKYADLNRHENSTSAKSVGVGLSLNYAIINQLDIEYDYMYQYAVELIVDHYFIKSHNFGIKYRPVDLGGFSPYGRLCFTKYNFGELSVYDEQLDTQSKKGQYIYDGKGFTFGLGMEYKMESVAFGLGWNKLFTIGELQSRTGWVEFTNKPKHSYFNLEIRAFF